AEGAWVPPPVRGRARPRPAGMAPGRHRQHRPQHGGGGRGPPRRGPRGRRGPLPLPLLVGERPGAARPPRPAAPPDGDARQAAGPPLRLRAPLPPRRRPRRLLILAPAPMPVPLKLLVLASYPTPEELAADRVAGRMMLRGLARRGIDWRLHQPWLPCPDLAD